MKRINIGLIILSLFSCLGIIFGQAAMDLRVRNLWDFGSFIAAGRAANLGLNPYIVYPEITAHMSSFVDINSPNLNAPFSVLLFQLISSVDPVSAFRVWIALSVLIFLLCVALLAFHYRRLNEPRLFIFALGNVGFWFTLFLGQIYIAILLGVVIAWLSLERRRYVIAGLTIGLLIAIKPTFALWPLLLALSGQKKPSAISFGFACILSILPTLFWGPTIYLQWLEASNRYGGFALPSNGSITGVITRLGLPSWLGLAASMIFLLFVAFWAWREKPENAKLNGVALSAMLLASPLGWAATMVWLLPIFFARRWSKLIWLAAIFSLLPDGVVWALSHLSPLTMNVFGNLYTAAIACALLGSAYANRDSISSPESVDHLQVIAKERKQGAGVT